MNSASDIFAIIGSAIRFNRGESLEDQTKRVSALWARFNEVARKNPHAWIREAYSAKEIGCASPNNPMISSPYTRLMNANARVDMAAAVIVCSLETARELGVPNEKLVFPARSSARPPAIRMAGDRWKSARVDR